jgi:hypothetical protein
MAHVGILESSSGVGVVVSETTIPATDIVPTCIFASTSARLRLSDVTADVTDTNSSGVTMTVVSTAMVCASRRRPSVCSVTEVICTAESTTLSALATPDTYAMRTAGMNASLLIKSVAVNITDTSVGVGVVIGIGVVVDFGVVVGFGVVIATMDAQKAEPAIEYVPTAQGVHED